MRTLRPTSPTTVSRTTAAETQEAIRNGVMHSVENGFGAFTFASEKAFEKRVEETAARAIERAMFADAIKRGHADIQAGCYLVGDAAWDEIEGLYIQERSCP